MSIEKFFSPKSVAVIGASRNPTKVGHVIFRNFLESGYEGKVYPINPNSHDLFGHRCYPSVLKVPGPLDMAVVTIPAPLVPKALEECGRKGVKAVILITAGFAEIGNKELDDKVRSTIKRFGMRVLGPNCLGVFDPQTGVDTLFLPRFKLGRPKAGGIAYITQSGATGSVVLDWMSMKGYNISKFVSYGNAMDIDEADLLEFLAKDKDTKVICAYLEGVKEGRKFFEIARKISRKKPVVVLKGGRTPEGSKATMSHTGSLAGEANIYDAVFRQAGIIRANDLEQIFDFARVLATQPKPKGRRVQIITDGGGYGVLTTDWVIKHGLEMAKMNSATVEAMKKKLPPQVVVKNPFDVLGDADTGRYSMAIEAALNDPGVDMLAVVALFQVPTLSGDVVEVIAEARGRKPMVVISGGGRYVEALKKPLEDVGVPTFSYPERAIAALKALYDYSV